MTTMSLYMTMAVMTFVTLESCRSLSCVEVAPRRTRSSHQELLTHPRTMRRPNTRGACWPGTVKTDGYIAVTVASALVHLTRIGSNAGVGGSSANRACRCHAPDAATTYNASATLIEPSLCRFGVRWDSMIGPPLMFASDGR